MSETLVQTYDWTADDAGRICVMNDEYFYREQTFRPLCVYSGSELCDPEKYICPSSEGETVSHVLTMAFKEFYRCPTDGENNCPAHIDEIAAGEACGADRICKYGHYCCDACGTFAVHTCGYSVLAQCETGSWKIFDLDESQQCALQSCDFLPECNSEADDFAAIRELSPTHCGSFLDASNREEFCQCLGNANHMGDLPACTLDEMSLQDWLHVCESKAPCESHHLSTLERAPAACLPLINSIQTRDQSLSHEGICACMLEAPPPLCTFEGISLAEWKHDCQAESRWDVKTTVPECLPADLIPLIATYEDGCLRVAETIRDGTVDISKFCECLELIFDPPACAFQGIPIVMWPDECTTRSQACADDITFSYFDSEIFPAEEELSNLESMSSLCPSLLQQQTLDDIPECVIGGFVFEEIIEHCQGLMDDNMILEGLQISNSLIDLDLLTWEIGGEYYFSGEPTCVAFGTQSSAQCDSSVHVCTSGTVGTLLHQGSLLVESIQNGGVHPHCPSSLEDCSFSALVSIAPHECVPLIGKTAYDETFCPCLLASMSSAVQDCEIFGRSIWHRYYDCESECSVLYLTDNSDEAYTGFWTKEDDIYISESGVALTVESDGNWHIDGDGSGYFSAAMDNQTFSGEKDMRLQCYCSHGLVFNNSNSTERVCIYRTQLYVNNAPTCIQAVADPSQCLDGFVCATENFDDYIETAAGNRHPDCTVDLQ